MSLRFKTSLACGVTALLWVTAAGVASAQVGSAGKSGSDGSSVASTPSVLELFTSQGCSSCPAADALLKTYASAPGVIALSLSVDYWDHLGWKDTLASPKNSARQKAYVKALGVGNVYTPQMVVNGFTHAIGSNKAEIDKAIAKSQKALASERVTVAARSDGTRVTIEIGGARPPEAMAPTATIWLMAVAPTVDVEIKRGENKGKMIAYHNVVRELSAVGMWSGAPLKIELPQSAVMEPGMRCAVVLQAGKGGRILGAAWMTP